MSPLITTAPEVILLGPPEGPEGREQRAQDEPMQDTLAPTEGNLGTSNIGAEPTLDKSSVVPEQTTIQPPEPQLQQQ